MIVQKLTIPIGRFSALQCWLKVVEAEEGLHNIDLEGLREYNHRS
jgi:hypothetical protein